MVEITHKGVWIKWSSLDARDRGWFVLSMVTTLPFGMVVGVHVGEWAYRLGHRHGSGGREADGAHFANLVGSDLYRYGVLAAFVAAALCAFAWWRFSLHQDELFNRIQNYAIGRAAAWSLAGATGWWLLTLGGWAGPFPLGAFIIASYGLLTGFWFYAVHRWAA